MGGRILVLEVMLDHVHVFIQVGAKTSPSDIVRLLKGFTSRYLGKQFPWLRCGIFGPRAIGYPQ